MIIFLGIKISTLSKKEVLKKIYNFLNNDKPHYIVTPNPEFLLTAKEDEEFFYILNQADLAIPDGIGLVLAGILKGKFIKRISGADLIYDICELAEKQRKSVFLLGGDNSIAQKAGEKLQALYPKLQVAGAESGLEAGEWEIKAGRWIHGEAKNKQLIERINKVKPDIIFVAFGHPKQEKWIYHTLTPNSFFSQYCRVKGQSKLPSVRLMMGVGGSFDFIAGKIKRAPRFIRVFGLEWLWRLIQEPRKRWKRIYNAVIVFPFIFIKESYINRFFYRKNVVGLIFNNNNQILLVDRAKVEYPHWNFPQGGVEYQESEEQAIIREITEEIGTNKLKIVKKFPNIYKYKWPKGYSNNGYKGQKQTLFILKFLGKDTEIKVNYWENKDWKWVDLDKVIDKVAEVKKEAARIFIKKFKEI